MWHCYLPNLKLFTDYIINITAVCPAGSSSHVSSFMLEDIGENGAQLDQARWFKFSAHWNANELFLSGSTVKPDPPINVRVSPKVRSLLVEWSLPLTWVHEDIFPLKYHIRYQRDKWGTPMFVNVRLTLIAHCGHLTSIWAASEIFFTKVTQRPNI